LRILQPEKGYRAGIDAVFLAAAVPCSPGDTLFEAGIGVGVAALCITARVPQLHITGMEVAARYAMLAEENAKRNNRANALRIIHTDLKEALRRDLTHLPVHGSFAHAYANPPYLEDGKSTPSPVSLRAVAHNFGPEDLDLWVKVLHTMLAPRGSCTVIYRADALGKLLQAMEGRFGDLRIAPLYVREGAAASRVVIQGMKGSRAPTQLLPGLQLHGPDNQFTRDAEAILRDGMAWRLR
jgi:tRNA1(Val) A37 N6-methylase TrmN6